MMHVKSHVLGAAGNTALETDAVGKRRLGSLSHLFMERHSGSLDMSWHFHGSARKYMLKNNWLSLSQPGISALPPS